jgi:hypothetical protein
MNSIIILLFNLFMSLIHLFSYRPRSSKVSSTSLVCSPLGLFRPRKKHPIFREKVRKQSSREYSVRIYIYITSCFGRDFTKLRFSSIFQIASSVLGRQKYVISALLCGCSNAIPKPDVKQLNLFKLTILAFSKVVIDYPLICFSKLCSRSIETHK